MKSEVIFQIQITEGGLKAKKEFEFKIVVEEVPRNTLFIYYPDLSFLNLVKMHSNIC